MSDSKDLPLGLGPRRAPKPAGGGPGPLKPMARVERVVLFEREIRERLSRTALDLMLDRAELLSEGQRASRQGKTLFFGSSMLTLDLTRLGTLLRDACDAGTAHRVAALLQKDAGAGSRIRALAGQEVTRLAGISPAAVNTEVRIRAQGTRVLVDVDVEATFPST